MIAVAFPGKGALCVPPHNLDRIGMTRVTLSLPARTWYEEAPKNVPQPLVPP